MKFLSKEYQMKISTDESEDKIMEISRDTKQKHTKWKIKGKKKKKNTKSRKSNIWWIAILKTPEKRG